MDQDSLGGLYNCRKCGESFTLKMSLDETLHGASPHESETPQQPPSVFPNGIEDADTMAAAMYASDSPSAKIGPFFVKRRLGGGAIGEVWLAHDADLHRDTAIKTLRREYSRDAEYLERFLREARSAAQLHHTNVVTIYQVGSEGEFVYIAMEVVDGGSLDRAVGQGQPMNWREASRAIRDAATGLAAAHEAGLVHRDVKPANLMRTGRGVTKVADFGLARGRSTDSQLTHQGTLLGTPAYLAPEIWMGQEADDRSDLYSLIITYYHLLTGALPFHAPNLPSIGYQHRYEPFPDPRRTVPSIPDAVCRILTRGASKDRGQRYQSGHEVAAELDALLSTPDEQLTFGAAWEELGGQVRIEHSDETVSEDGQLRSTDRDESDCKEPQASRPIDSSGPVSQTPSLPARFRPPRWLIAASCTAAVVLLCVIAIVVSRRDTPRVETSERSAANSARGKASRSAPPMAMAPFDAAAARKHQAAWAAFLEVPLEISNSIGMTLSLIPPGEFTMCSPSSEPNRHSSEVQHTVRITRPFRMGAFEVTQAQYSEVMGKNPSYFASTGEGKGFVEGRDTSRLPVENMPWEDAADFCLKLSERPEERAAGRTYRLPTEAEWEYACRAGTTTPFYFGTQLNGDQANCNGNLPYGTDVKGPFLERTIAVGSYSANPFGLFDMHGNVREWCGDWFGRDYFSQSFMENPAGPSNGIVHVRRGGGWSTDAVSCRSSHRYRGEPPYSGNYLGFRVVMVLSDALRLADPRLH